MSSHTHIACPSCGAGELRPCSPYLFRCDECDQTLEEALLKTLFQIRKLPDAIGRHACDCGHPEMRHLPDNVFWCPACCLEVTPSLHP